MKFKLRDILQPELKSNKDLIKSLLPNNPIDVERSIEHKSENDGNGVFTLELTFYIILSNGSTNNVLVNYFDQAVFYINRDNSSIEDCKLDLFNKLTAGQRNAWLYVLLNQPDMIVNVGHNQNIPSICDKIISGLTNLGFFD